MTLVEIQKALTARGYNPGPADGVMGTLTRNAVKAFQRDNDLTVDGIPGRNTIAKLKADPGDPPADVAESDAPVPWFDMMDQYRRQGYDERGEKEEIADWASDLGIANFDATKTPWCGLAVAQVITASLPDEPIPSNILGARNWAKFGVECEPQIGAVLVFWRGSPSGWQGHVGLYAGEGKVKGKPAFKVLGGNQSDAVTFTWIEKGRLLTARWPSTAPFLATGKVEAGGGGTLSTNEA